MSLVTMTKLKIVVLWDYYLCDGSGRAWT